MDPKDELTQLLKQKQSTAPTGGWDALQKEWLADLEWLMGEVDRWSARYQGLLEVKKRSIRICESPSIPESAYIAPARTLLAPDGKSVEILPRARGVFGAQGRVDLAAGTAHAMLARFGPRHWFFVWQDPPESEWKSAPFTEETFAATLKELIS